MFSEKKCIEGICCQHILVVEVHGNGSSGNLLFRQLNGEHLIVRKGHLLQNDDVPIATLEPYGTVQYQSRFQLDGLDSGCLLLFLGLKLHSSLIYIERKIGLV